MSITAAGLAAAITSAQGPAEDPSKQDDANMKLATGIVTYLAANLQVLIPPDAIATVGGPTSQAGPVAPVLLSVAP